MSAAAGSDSQSSGSAASGPSSRAWTIPGPPRVGRYGVDLEALERLAVPALEEAGGPDVAIIDELGKMELASGAFRDAVSALFDRPVRVLATVQTSAHPLTDALKRRADIETFRVTTANRDEFPQLLAARLASTDLD